MAAGTVPEPSPHARAGRDGSAASARKEICLELSLVGARLPAAAPCRPETARRQMRSKRERGCPGYFQSIVFSSWSLRVTTVARFQGRNSSVPSSFHRTAARMRKQATGLMSFAPSPSVPLVRKSWMKRSFDTTTRLPHCSIRSTCPTSPPSTTCQSPRRSAASGGSGSVQPARTSAGHCSTSQSGVYAFGMSSARSAEPSSSGSEQ